MVSHKMYCVKCRGKKMCSNVKFQRDVRGKPRMCGVCNACGIKCYQYISASKYAKSKSRSSSRSRKV